MSVHENTDGNGWRKLAEVTDGDSYEFTITEDFAINLSRTLEEAMLSKFYGVSAIEAKPKDEWKSKKRKNLDWISPFPEATILLLLEILFFQPQIGKQTLCIQ